MIFLNSASVCTHNDTEGKREMPEPGIFLKIRKKTIFNEHPVSEAKIKDPSVELLL